MSEGVDRVSAWSPDLVSRSILIQIAYDLAKTTFGSHREFRAFLLMTVAWVVNEVVIEFIDASVSRANAISRRNSRAEIRSRRFHQQQQRRGRQLKKSLGIDGNELRIRRKSGGSSPDRSQQLHTSVKVRFSAKQRCSEVMDCDDYDDGIKNAYRDIGISIAGDEKYLWKRLFELLVVLFGTIRIYTMTSLAYMVTDAMMGSAFAGMSDNMRGAFGLAAAHCLISVINSARGGIVDCVRRLAETSPGE